MKKFFVSILVILSASLSATMFAGTPIKQTDLPKTAQTFITKYFSGDEVKKVEKDEGRRGTEYEVDFANGAEVVFNSDGGWKEVKAAKGKTVAADLIPSAISKYVATNHKEQSIVELGRKRGGYEIKLSNGTELRLTEDAQPMQARQGKHGNGAPRGNGGQRGKK